MNPIQQALIQLTQGANRMNKNPLQMAGNYIKDTYIKDPRSGQMFPQGLISAKSPRDFAMKGVMGLSTPVSGKPLRSVHPEDLDVMENFITSVRSKKPNPQVQLDASRIAEHYGLPMPKTTNGLANSFDNLLQSYVQSLRKR